MATKTIDYSKISGIKPKTIKCSLKGVDTVVLNNLYGEFEEVVGVTVKGNNITFNFYNHGYIKFTNVANPSEIALKVYKENQTVPTYNNTFEALCEYKEAIPAITINTKKHTVAGTIFADVIDVSDEAKYSLGKKGKGYTVKANAGDDRITGTKGNDTLTGGLGTDTFVYKSGIDTITDANKDDVIELSGVDFDEFSLVKNGNNLEMIKDANNKIILKNHFKKSAEERLNVVLSDEEEIQLSQQEYVIAGKGKLVGTEYDDTFTSSKSNDTFTGKTGVNVIKFDSNKFGKDTVNLTEGENLVLDFSGTEYTDWNVKRTISGNNLVLTVRDWNEKGTKAVTLGTITIKNFAKTNVVGEEGSVILRLAEGDYDLNETDFDVNPTKNYTGSRFTEYIDPSEAKKAITIAGGKGDDYISTASKATTFVFTSGDGNDVISSSKENDVIRIDSVGEVTYTNKGADLLIEYGDGDSILVGGYYLAEDDERIDTLKVKNASGKYDTISLAEETDVEEYKKHVLDVRINDGKILLEQDTKYTTINFVGYTGDTTIYTYGPEYGYNEDLYIPYGNSDPDGDNDDVIILKDFFVNKGHPTKYVVIGGETYDMMRRFYTTAKDDIVAPMTEDWLYMEGGNHTVTFTENNYYHIHDYIYSEGAQYTDTLVLDDYSFRNNEIVLGRESGPTGSLCIDADDGIEYADGGRRNHILYRHYFDGATPLVKIQDRNGVIDVARATTTTNIDWSVAGEKNKDHALFISNYSQEVGDKTTSTIVSGEKRNKIYQSSGGNAVINYTYGGGDDTVWTDGQHKNDGSGYYGTNDTYTVGSFTATTKLNVADYGGVDNDTLNIGANSDDFYILFNAGNLGLKNSITPDDRNTAFVHKDVMTVDTLKQYLAYSNYEKTENNISGVIITGGNARGGVYDEDLQREAFPYGSSIENVKTIDNQDGLDVIAWKEVVAGKILNWLVNNETVEGKNLWFYYYSVEGVMRAIENGDATLTDAQYESLLDCYKVKYSEIPESKTFASTTGNDNFEFGVANNTVTYSNQAMGKDTIVSDNEEYNASYKDRIIFANNTGWAVKDGTLDVDVDGNDLVISTDENNSVTYKNFVSDENHNEVILIDGAEDKYYLSTVTSGNTYRDGSNNIFFVYNDNSSNSIGSTTGRNFIYSYGEYNPEWAQEEPNYGMSNCVYKGGEDTVISFSDKANDRYEIYAFSKNSKLNVTDMGGNSDSLHVGYTSPQYDVEVPIISDVRFVFDVDADGAVYDDFMFVHKEALSGTTLHNTTQGDLVAGVLRYNAVPTVADSFGIENFTYFESYEKVGDEYPYVRIDIDIDTWKDEIVQNVQGWLTTHNTYTSAYDAFENCTDPTAMADLAACYNVDYTTLNQG